MILVKCGQTYHLETARSAGMRVQPSRTEIVKGSAETKEDPKDDAEAIAIAAAKPMVAPHLNFYPLNVSMGSMTMIGYFAESPGVQGETIPASRFRQG